ncbi:cysteine hydrolase family protein [Carboxylicivirga sp. RSCT41]|uniref:cysteine hydrolase family protein n=1 Tax=Carboxylicivirga agarovorans TaxID=3417570 RepID=UPI003D33DC00
MKTLVIFAVFLMGLIDAGAQSEESKALLLIDIQDFYFPGGNAELVGALEAAEVASKVLQCFRDNGDLVVHVAHQVKSGGDIHRAVEARDSEKVFVKSDVNAFKNTGLKEFLDKNNINELVIIGMQTHMCLEAAVRAAADYGYKVSVVNEACATRDLKFDEKIISAEQVHYSTLSTLRSYAEVLSYEDFEKKFLN